MEQQTKNCPYCGEEIMATATKCKHCGEWLDQEEEQANTTETAELENETDEQQSAPVDDAIPSYSVICFWVALAGVLVSVVHALGLTHGNGWLSALRVIPEEVGEIIEMLGFVGLLSLLMKLTKSFGKPMNALFGTSIALYALGTICGMVEADAVQLIAAVMIIAAMIVFCIIGFKFTGHQNVLKSLGVGMIIWSIAFIILVIICASVLESEGIATCVYAILSVTLYYVLNDTIADACNQPQKTSHKGWAYIIGAFIASLVIAFTFGGEPDDYENTNENYPEIYEDEDYMDDDYEADEELEDAYYEYEED